MPEVVLPLVVLDPVGDEILEQLLQWATFGDAGATNFTDGRRERRVSVGNAETEQDARDTLVESLDDIAPKWREHLRLIWPDT
jgi:hypothetical protein